MKQITPDTQHTLSEYETSLCKLDSVLRFWHGFVGVKWMLETDVGGGGRFLVMDYVSWLSYIPIISNYLAKRQKCHWWRRKEKKATISHTSEGRTEAGRHGKRRLALPINLFGYREVTTVNMRRASNRTIFLRSGPPYPPQSSVI